MVSLQTFKKDIIPILHKHFQRTEKLIFETGRTLISKSNKDIKNNYRPMSLTDIGTKILNKILSNQSDIYSKKVS